MLRLRFTLRSRSAASPPAAPAAAPTTRLRARVLAWALAAFTAFGAVPLLALTAAPPAAAATTFDPSQFHGVHWSRLGDNFTADPLVLQGLSACRRLQRDPRPKADAMFANLRDQPRREHRADPDQPGHRGRHQLLRRHRLRGRARLQGHPVLLVPGRDQHGELQPAAVLEPDVGHRVRQVRLPAAGLLRPDQRADRLHDPAVAGLRRHVHHPREQQRGSPSNRLFIEGAQLDGGGWAATCGRCATTPASTASTWRCTATPSPTPRAPTTNGSPTSRP